METTKNRTRKIRLVLDVEFEKGTNVQIMEDLYSDLELGVSAMFDAGNVNGTQDGAFYDSVEEHDFDRLMLTDRIQVVCDVSFENGTELSLMEDLHDDIEMGVSAMMETGSSGNPYDAAFYDSVVSYSFRNFRLLYSTK